MQKYKHSQVLFVRDDGLPMEFYIRAGLSQRLEIRSLIEHGGGIVRYIEGKGIIRLVSLGTKVLRASKEGLTISVQYIYDCVAKNRLLDTSSYVVRVRLEQTSDISDEDEDDVHKTKRPSAVPLSVQAEKISSGIVPRGKHHEKAQRINQTNLSHWTNGVREDSINMRYNRSSSSSSTDCSDESMSLLQKKSRLVTFKSPPKRTRQSSPGRISASSKYVHSQSKPPKARPGKCNTSNQKTDPDSDGENSAGLDRYDVNLLEKSKNFLRSDTNQVDEPVACGSGATRANSTHRTSSHFEKSPTSALLAPRDLSQPSSSNDTHVSPTPNSEEDEDEAPYRREIDLSIVEAVCVLKDVENLVLFCKLSEEPETTRSNVRRVNRLKRIVYKSLAAADAALVLKKTKLSTYDKAVLFKYLLCEDNVHPKSATTLLSKFLTDDSQSNSRISKKKT